MFNSDFSLCGNRSIVFQSQTHAEILDLQREVESLYKGRKTLNCTVVMADGCCMLELYIDSCRNKSVTGIITGRTEDIVVALCIKAVVGDFY